MKINFMHLWTLYKIQILLGTGMAGSGLALGILSAPLSPSYVSIQPRTVSNKPVNTYTFAQPATASQAQAASPSQAELTAFFPDYLNLNLILGEGESGPGARTMAAILLDQLSAMDGAWIAEIYDLYTQYQQEAGQSTEGIQMAAVNGTAQSAENYSNAKEILSMASVLYYYGVLTSQQEISDYIVQLWEASHSYSYEPGEMYFCDGCLDGLSPVTSSPSQASPAEAQATSSQAEPAAAVVEGIEGGPGVSGAFAVQEDESQPEAAKEESSDSLYTTWCPGHRDLVVQIQVNGIDDQLFSLDSFGSLPRMEDSVNWPGWTQETMDYVRTLAAQDWQEMYGLWTDSLLIRNPLSSQEMDLYMNLIPEDASKDRRAVVSFALSSVGRVPYYWGGKPRAAGYTGNHFGSVTTPDVDGRFLRGLDCSGWISWVYWSATGSRLAGESTSTLISCGEAVDPEELLPGDICIRTEGEAHVVMFLGWTEDGQMLCIQETSGNINNVEVGIVTPKWQHYLRLIQ